MGAAERMNTNEKGICFAREIKFISRLQGNALALPKVPWASEPRVPWASEKGTDPREGKGGQGMVCSRWGEFHGCLTGVAPATQTVFSAPFGRMNQCRVKALEPWALPPWSSGSPWALAHERVAGPTAWAGDTWRAGGTGIRDARPGGSACIRCGARVAGQPGEKE